MKFYYKYAVYLTKFTLTFSPILATATATATASAEPRRSFRRNKIDLWLIGHLHQPITAVRSEASQGQKQHAHAQLKNG